MDCYRPMILDAYIICLARQNWKPEPLNDCLKECEQEYDKRRIQTGNFAKSANDANATVNPKDKDKILQGLGVGILMALNEVLYYQCKKKCREDFACPFANCI